MAGNNQLSLAIQSKKRMNFMVHPFFMGLFTL